MRKAMTLLLAMVFLLGTAGLATAAGNQLKENESKVRQEFKDEIPEDAWRNVKQLHEEWQKKQKGESDAFLLDVRTDSEFNAFHIEGADHVQAGHMYTIPRFIKDPNANIWVYCRTSARATYVGGFLYKYGYKNVKVVDGGIVGWCAERYPVVNQFTGQFKVTKYRKWPSQTETDMYNFRMWNVYKKSDVHSWIWE